jgi:DNA end-binding protein Ku
VAVGRVVIRTRQHLALILPRDEHLLLLLLRFEHELRKPEKLDLPKAGSKKLGVTPRERQMAETLIESMIGEWRPEQFKDTYRDDLLKLIKDKVKHGGRDEEPEAEAPAPRRAEVIDLVDLLKQSLAKPRKPARASKKTRKKRPRKAAGERKLKKSA